MIGALSAIAIPSYTNFVNKAKQTEAQTNLRGIYTAETVFFAEYTKYHTAFQAIGYRPEGQFRYNIGFGTSLVVAGPADGFNMVVPNPTAISTMTYCGGTGLNVPGNACTTTDDANVLGVNLMPYTTTNNAFTVFAVAKNVSLSMNQQNVIPNNRSNMVLVLASAISAPSAHAFISASCFPYDLMSIDNNNNLVDTPSNTCPEM